MIATAHKFFWKRLIVGFALTASCTVNVAQEAQQELKLPNLGESSTSLFSSEFEYQLGRAWLRAFRSQAPTIEDPLLFDYLENLIYNLVTNSQLDDRRIDLVVVDNPTINAFAVPGGVIGIHNGLLTYAQSEDELATVLAHEIAHLSQRHFSRGVEAAKRNQPLTMAAMLASFVLLATTGSDIGMAALSATQAASIDSKLRFSRSNEAEADRVGMQTLVESGFDPHAAPDMFGRMLQATRFSSGNRVPEFMRTHPLSESRIADTQTRALQYPKRPPSQNIHFHLMRARVLNSLSSTPEAAVQRFRSELDGKSLSAEASRYGLALALTDAGRAADARAELDTLLAIAPDRLEYILAEAELDIATYETERAIANLERQLRLSPGNHPLTMTYASALMKAEQPHIAEEVLLEQGKRRPNDPALWYLLAEAQGLSGNIAGLHQSRAEYFIINGYLDQAKSQLNYALDLTEDDFTASARIRHRLQDIARMRERMEL